MQPLVCHHRVGRRRRRRRHPLRPMVAAGEMVLRAALAGLVTDADRGQCEAVERNSMNMFTKILLVQEGTVLLPPMHVYHNSSTVLFSYT